jgi:acetyltransferase-like isoleucine patch superfamily enzyme
MLQGRIMLTTAKVAFIFTRAWRWFTRRVRWLFYYMVLGRLGGGTTVASRVFIEHPYNVFIGRNCAVNQYVLLQGSPGGEIHMGDRVVLSYGAIVLTATRKYVGGRYSIEHEAKSVIIEDGAWIAAGAVVLPGVKIGANATVAAGAVVTKDVAPGVVVAGVPARLICVADMKGFDTDK